MGSGPYSRFSDQEAAHLDARNETVHKMLRSEDARDRDRGLLACELMAVERQQRPKAILKDVEQGMELYVTERAWCWGRDGEASGEHTRESLTAALQAAMARMKQDDAEQPEEPLQSASPLEAAS